MKTIVLDTNVFLDNPSFLDALSDTLAVIPFVVVKELEVLKTKHDLVGKHARQVLNYLDSLRETGSLLEGVALADGLVVRVGQPDTSAEPSNDDRIILEAKFAKAELITNDTAMRILADLDGVRSSTLKNLVGDLEVRDRSEVTLTTWEKDELYRSKYLPVSEAYFPNEFILSNQVIGRFSEGQIKLLNSDIQAFSVKPRSKEQIYALNVLLDPKIPLVIMTGAAGCGKTLLAMAAAMQSVVEDHTYEKAMVTRPIIPMGNDIGYLPGSLEEKLSPWIQPLMDNLLVLAKGNVQTMLHYRERWIELEALTFIRGRSIPKRFFIIDEAQNLSPSEIKTIVTRVGEGSKIVFTGDLEQIDVNRSDRSSNGLSYLITKMQDQALAAHIHLKKGERSPLATLAADLL